MKKLLPYIIIPLAVLGLYFVVDRIAYHRGYNQGLANIKIDTLFIRDTIPGEIPEPLVEVKYVKGEPEVVYIPVTQYKHDTVWRIVQREQKTYATEKYKAVVSGFLPSLDYIETYDETIYVTQTVTEPVSRKHTFLELDASLAYGKEFSAPIVLKFGKEWGPAQVYCGGGYDPILKSPTIQMGGRLRVEWSK